MNTSENAETMPSPENYFCFKYDLLEKYIETLKDDKEILTYLVNAEAAYRRDNLKINYGQDAIFGFDAPDFGEKCNIEYERRIKLVDLKKGVKRHPDLNEYTAYLFLNYLLDFASDKSRDKSGAGLKKLTYATKNRIIEFLTSYSPSQTKKLPAKFAEEKYAAQEVDQGPSKKFYNAMKIVRKYFMELGLSEIVEKIDKDLEGDYEEN